MTARTGILRNLFWDPAKTTIKSLSTSGSANPTYAELKALFVKGKRIAGVTELPSYGAPPATVNSRTFGEDVAKAIPSQADPNEGTILLDFDEGITQHKAFHDLAAGSQMVVAIFTVTKPGSGADPKMPNSTGVEGTFRLIEGTKSGKGEVPGGQVNDIENYRFGIAKSDELTVWYA